MLAEVRDFSMPANPTISNIQSWISNQIVPLVAFSSFMEPFQEFSQPKIKVKRYFGRVTSKSFSKK